MSLGNIIDRRTKKLTVSKLDVVFEPSSHDNSAGQDQFEDVKEDKHLFSVDWKYGISLNEAIEFANTFKTPITIYLYDGDSDPVGLNTTNDEEKE